MPERASILQGFQLGVETTPGTSVAANKKITAANLTLGPQVDITKFRPTGYKFGSLASLNREWVQGSLSGPLTYTEIVYWLSSLLKSVTPTGTTAYTWTFSPSTTAADTVKTFTIEQGSSTRAHKFTYGLVTGLSMSFSRDGCEIDGTIIGQDLSDGITLTSSPSTIALVPVTPPQVAVYLADTQAGLDGASALTRAISVEWSITDRFAPVWVLNQATDWAAHVETEPTPRVTLMVQADSTGMGLLTTMRANSKKFVRIEATGGTIDGTTNYSLKIDTACQVTDISDFQDEDGVFAIEWTMDAIHDTTWGKATEVTVVNGISAL
ncbi:MAG: hypothetical protein KatS3mg051_1192 [Anaerolineae bacterium]|nr:MAG: hypothetical protein KatS3mg051_1082 [Anaerolineae bacterium]GIV81838.1 MAG: hypothetical protein KatS3mg051_1192 [Anaerolineae bacterium]